MLTKKCQSNYFAKTTKKAQGHLKAFCNTQDAEDLHQFRVNIKKLAAALSIIKRHPSNGNLLKVFAPVKAIFKQAGLMRNLDVNLELVSAYPMIKQSFIISQQKKRDKRVKTFVAATEKNERIIESVSSKLGRRFFDVEDTYIIEKLRKHLYKISKAVSMNETDVEILHNNRKKIKMLLYTHEMLPKSISSMTAIDTDYLDKVQNAIGRWHDLVVAESYLRKFKNKNSMISNELELQKQSTFRKLRKQIRGFSMKAVKRI